MSKELQKLGHELKKLVKEGDIEGVRGLLARGKRPTIHDLLWCATFADGACRALLLDVATQKKIPKPKKGYAWNEAHAAAISGDPAAIAKAEKRGADFEAVVTFGTPLTLAVRLDHADLVRALLAKGVDHDAPVKMARVKGVSIFSGTMFMTEATPLGVALRLGHEATVDVLLETVELKPEHLADAVQGGNETLLRRVLDLLGDRAPLTPALFWRVHYPSVLPVLAERGFDVTALPTDTGNWGGPIWSWWAYNLWQGESHIDHFAALFATGVRGTASGLGDVLGANSRGIASTEMIDLFLANGADLGDEIQWESEEWDEENDCQKKVVGSLAERMMNEADLQLVQYLHEKGAAIRPMRASPDWRDADDKKAWLERLGMVKAIESKDFPWMDSPSADEVRSFLASEHGIYGLKLGMTREDLGDFDVERAEDGDGLFIAFSDEGALESASRQYYELAYDACEAIPETLTKHLGKPKGRGKTKKWSIPGGHVTLREDHNDAGHFLYLNMLAAN